MKNISIFANKIEEISLVLLLFLMTVFVLLEMFGRYVAYIPIAATLELTQYLLIWFGWLSASFTLGRHAHIRVTFLVDKFSAGKRRIVELGVYAFVLAVAIVLVYAGSFAVYKTYVMKQMTPSLQLPVWIIYVVVPLAGFNISLRSLADIIRMLCKKELPSSSPSVNLME